MVTCWKMMVKTPKKIVDEAKKALPISQLTMLGRVISRTVSINLFHSPSITSLLCFNMNALLPRTLLVISVFLLICFEQLTWPSGVICLWIMNCADTQKEVNEVHCFLLFLTSKVDVTSKHNPIINVVINAIDVTDKFSSRIFVVWVWYLVLVSVKIFVVEVVFVIIEVEASKLNKTNRRVALPSQLLLITYSQAENESYKSCLAHESDCACRHQKDFKEGLRCSAKRNYERFSWSETVWGKGWDWTKFRRKA